MPQTCEEHWHRSTTLAPQKLTALSAGSPPFKAAAVLESSGIGYYDRCYNRAIIFIKV